MAAANGAINIWTRHKIQKEKYMSSVINMLIMCHFHHPSIGMEDKNLQIVSTLTDTNQALPTI